MTKWIDVTGKTEDEAIAAALGQLKMDRDDVSVEVLERAKSGFLGLGGTPAKVRVRYEVPDEPKEEVQVRPVSVCAPAPKPKPAPVPKPESAETAKPAPAPKPESVERAKPEKTESPEKRAAASARAAKTEEFLLGLLQRMGASARPVVTEGADGSLRVVLEGERLGALIGRRGETLDAIQHLTNYAVNHGEDKRVRVFVDAEGYRQKREESLQRLAEKVAGKVVKYRKNMMLEPMNAYERHVIHTALQDWEDIITYSTGSEPNRRVVIAFSKGGPKDV